MKLIKQSIKYVPQQSGLEGIYKQIELGGKVCYQSSHTIKEDSAKRFVEDVLIKNGHGRPLEHGTVYLKVLLNNELVLRDAYGENNSVSVYNRYINNKYSKVNCRSGLENIFITDTVEPGYAYITTNLRVLVENNWLDDLQYLCEPTEYHAKRVTFNVVCDRQIQTEIKTHTTLSSTFESTRYCNYNKDKFGNELTFIIPGNTTLAEGAYFRPWDGPVTATDEEFELCNTLANLEESYLELIKGGWKPQYAAKVLPNALKSEGYITGFVEDWQHFFNMRCASNAHPDIQELAKSIREQMIELGYIN